MSGFELAAIDELHRECIAAQFRVCLEELDRLAGTCRSLARSTARRTRKSSAYTELAVQLDADMARLRDLLREKLHRNTADSGRSGGAKSHKQAEAR